MQVILKPVLCGIFLVTSANAQMIVCTFDAADRSICEKNRGLCERVFKLDGEEKLVLQASGYPRGSWRTLTTRMWTDLRIEVASELAPSFQDKDGNNVFSSVRVVTFDRAIGTFLAFDEYKDGNGQVLDSKGINQFNQQYNFPGGILFGALPDRRMETGVCKVQEKRF
jgi:hypothetical protein